MMNIPVDFLNELKRADGEDVTIVVNRRILYQVIAAVQLAMRHPELGADLKKDLKGNLGQLETCFSEFPELLKTIKRGYDPTFDVINTTRRHS